MSGTWRTTPSVFRSVLLVVLATCRLPHAFAQVQYQTEVAAAEFEFFEGNYEDALFRIDTALDWLKQKTNKDLIIAQNLDYSVLEGLGLGLKAQMQAHLGEVDKAKPLIKRARKTLETRRTYYIRLGQNARYFWLCEAFLDYAQGDIEYDQYMPQEIADVAGLPKELMPDGKDDKRLERCRKHYEYALRTLEDVRKGGGVAAPKDKGDAAFSDEHTSLSANLLMRVGRVLRLEAERKDDDAQRRLVLKQAKSMYEQAEQRLRTLSSYDVAINPNTKFPNSLKEFEKMKKDNKDVAAELIDNSKHEYARVVIHWVYHQCDYAELLACLADKAQNVEERTKQIEELDEKYNKTADLCQENFRENHPVFHWVKVSHARFFLALARQAEAKVKQLEGAGVQGKELEQARNRAVAHRKRCEWMTAGARDAMKKQLSPRHPLLLQASLLQLEMIRTDDPDRNKKVAGLCKEIAELVAQRTNDKVKREAEKQEL